MTRKTKRRPKRTVSKAEQRAMADLLTAYMARREASNRELRAKQARLLKILAKRQLH